MADQEYVLVVPTRLNGTTKAFWFHRESGHVIHRRADGSMECFTFHCHHEV